MFCWTSAYFLLLCYGFKKISKCQKLIWNYPMFNCMCRMPSCLHGSSWLKKENLRSYFHNVDWPVYCTTCTCSVPTYFTAMVLHWLEVAFGEVVRSFLDKAVSCSLIEQLMYHMDCFMNNFSTFVHWHIIHWYLCAKKKSKS